ncbi:hypothetical protein CDCA_CDCA17G4364 [Cyanidium caldarium]|uniref:HORMA domain-containing protein n=1 Tax=Cyanidium caldarium TaxID=2771 RepID=A0AAV9J1Z3_CYACA|nr:hypothetical protein CDCA_CDCA17G4364 [Cyanidium caldarium]
MDSEPAARRGTTAVSLGEWVCEWLVLLTHCTLYAARVYPAWFFERRRAYGVPVYVAVHPKLQRYVQRHIQAAAQQWLSTGQLEAFGVAIQLLPEGVRDSSVKAAAQGDSDGGGGGTSPVTARHRLATLRVDGLHIDGWTTAIRRGEETQQYASLLCHFRDALCRTLSYPWPALTGAERAGRQQRIFEIFFLATAATGLRFHADCEFGLDIDEHWVPHVDRSPPSATAAPSFPLTAEAEPAEQWVPLLDAAFAAPTSGTAVHFHLAVIE